METVISTMRVTCRVIVTLLILMLFPSISNGKMYGLFYGVNGDGLRCPENDVSDLASLYRSKGGNVILIRGNKINKYVVINNLKKQAMACTMNDILIFAYSGHGNNSLIMCGNTEYIPFYEIKQIISKSRARRKVLILDSCRSGSIADTNGLVKDKLTQVVVFTSSRGTQDSWETRGKRNSVFFTLLLKGLRGKADYNRDKKVTASELYKYVSRSSYLQNPTMKGRFSRDLVLSTIRK